MHARVRHNRHRQQHAFDRYELVARFFGDVFGLLHDFAEFLIRVAFDPLPRHFGQFVKRFLDQFQRPFRIAARARNQTRAQAFLIVQQNFQQMFGSQILMVAALRQPAGGLNEAAAPVCKFFDIH